MPIADGPNGQTGDMDEVLIDAANGRSLRIYGCRTKDGDGIWSYDLEFHFGGGQASVEAFEIDDGPAGFSRELANSWTGFDGMREFQSLEGNLTLVCRHDGVGKVVCDVSVREPTPPAWEARAEMDFGAGAHLERIASELESLRPTG